MFSISILEGLGLGFGRLFGTFFRPKIIENIKNAILVKTLKIVILPW